MDEVMLAGGIYSGNSTYYLYTEQEYRLSTPYAFINGFNNGFAVDSSGNIGTSRVDNENGVRPSISLKPGFSIVEGGTGTTDNPYVVNTE